MYIDNVKIGDIVFVTYYHICYYGKNLDKVDYIDKHTSIEEIVLYNNQLCVQMICDGIKFVRPIFDNNFYYKILSIKKV